MLLIFARLTSNMQHFLFANTNNYQEPSILPFCFLQDFKNFVMKKIPYGGLMLTIFFILLKTER